jgi:hypothetical protein
MAEEIPITITKADLGRVEPEIGLTANDLKLFDDEGKIRVSVVVDGELVEPKKDNDSIVFKASLSPNSDKLTVVVTTKDGKILNVLLYDQKGHPVDDDTTGDGAAVIKGIGEAAQEIRDVSGRRRRQ